MGGPTQPISLEMHAEKYQEDGETFQTAMARIANALKDDKPHRIKFEDILQDQRFMPAGRIQAAAGARRVVTPYNCFVSGTIEDTFVDGSGSIMGRATEAAQTMRLGGGIGYDFSTIRPSGALIKRLGSNATGPVSFMHIYDSLCHCVASAGHRRGAQMAVLRVDHPDIETFVHAKKDQHTLTGFNISVAITDEFMEHLDNGTPFPLRFGGEIYGHTDPVELWNKIMLNAWDWAEPGVLFIDTINSENNLWYTETIAATNPCGEQPLPPFGACLLGSFNLPKYLTRSNTFDYDYLRQDMEPVVRAMDNVIDRAEYPLPEQGREARAKRRMGLGVTGLANCIETMGYAYGSENFLKVQDQIMGEIARMSYLSSVELARDKGSFAKLDVEKYLQSGFMLRADPEVRDQIRRYGIRNSHLTSIAPTGTISLCADNVSSGIEPVFNLEYKRKIRTDVDYREEVVKDYAYSKHGVVGKVSDKVTVDEHLAVLTTAQRNVDSAVSKTCNVPGTVNFDQFKQLYTRAYQGGAKGCTAFRKDGKRMGILSDAPAPDEGAACRIDEYGSRTCE